MSLVGQGLVKRYNRRAVVDGVSLEVGPGETVGLLGPNGAGKTTTFYLLVGLVLADAGTVKIGDAEVSRLPMARRARLGLGYLAQENSSFRHLTVAQNITAILEWTPLTPDQRRERLERLLRDFHLERVRDVPVAVVSGGERRRTEIARALAREPSYLLLDEPFTGIDPIAVSELQDIVSDLRSQRLGLVITDHNVRETLRITDRSYIMYEGRILTAGTAQELLDDPVARRFYLGDRFELT